MKISGETKLKDLKLAFREVFPNLKIEFYSSPHQNGEGTSEEYLLDDSLRVRSGTGKAQPGYISLNEKMKVGDFESIFREQFGLNAQVFRRTYQGWLQTWASDTWTLEEQNNRAKSFL